jgi:uncharacterized membrane protein YhdT
MIDGSVWTLFVAVILLFLMLQYPLHPRRNLTRVRIRDMFALLGFVSVWCWLTLGERPPSDDGEATAMYRPQTLGVLILAMVFTAFFLHALSHRFPYSFKSGTRPNRGMIALVLIAFLELAYALYVEMKGRGVIGKGRWVELARYLLPRLILPVLWILLEACLANRGPCLLSRGLHVHHYQIGFVLLLFFGRDTWISAATAGVLMGLLVEGIAVYGAAPLLVQSYWRWPDAVVGWKLLSKNRLRVSLSRPWQDGMTDVLEFVLQHASNPK